jgi:hypothetical protein
MPRKVGVVMLYLMLLVGALALIVTVIDDMKVNHVITGNVYTPKMQIVEHCRRIYSAHVNEGHNKRMPWARTGESIMQWCDRMAHLISYPNGNACVDRMTVYGYVIDWLASEDELFNHHIYSMIESKKAAMRNDVARIARTRTYEEMFDEWCDMRMQAAARQ